ALVETHPRERAWLVLRAAEGMLSAANHMRRPFVRFRTAPRLSGAGGEQLRAGFLAKARSLEPQATASLLRKLLVSGGSFLTEAARQRAAERLAAWSERDPLDALDLLYLYDRSGRWASGTRARFRNTFDLLFDNRVTRRTLAMPPAVRWSERPIFETIVRLAPALRDVPLIGRRWCFERGARFWHAGWRARAAVKRADSRRAGFDWRTTLGTPPLGPIFREQILGGPAALFEVVDRARVEKALGRASVGREQALLLWHVYTASMLLSGDWLGERPAVEPVRIPLPRRLRRAAG
ncbi:MAG TPA: hypothetical protein VMZ28_10525, partial [Kofleriaceae bacterium]|nr:hypothetical protein [Kofleriaceae bacterium]